MKIKAHWVNSTQPDLNPAIESRYEKSLKEVFTDDREWNEISKHAENQAFSGLTVPEPRVIVCFTRS